MAGIGVAAEAAATPSIAPSLQPARSGSGQSVTEDATGILDAKIAFFEALVGFRAEGLTSDEQLQLAANQLAGLTGDDAALRIALYYGALAPPDRVAGFLMEERFDAIHDLVHLMDTRARTGQPEPGEHRRITARLVDFIGVARELLDQVPAAHGESLAARLAMRGLEQRWPGTHEEQNAEFRRQAEQAQSSASFAIRAFEGAGMATPQLEPEWVLARLALIDDDLAEAERCFRRMNTIASRSGHDAWRERALMGLVGVAHEHGSPIRASAALSELATFRSPQDCWGLAREVAVLRLGRDEAAEAILWLESHPPNPGIDREIEAVTAQDEWAALMAAAHLRADRPFQARLVLDTMASAEARDTSEESERRSLPLRVVLQLELGDPEGALATLEEPAAAALEAKDRHTLRGSAYLAAGRTTEAIAELEAALAAAAKRDVQDRRAVVDASAVGEWLGLSAVTDLAKAYLVGRHDALGAAAAIEAAHGSMTVEEARGRLLTLASSMDLGLITWIAGADTTLMIHVEASGRATHASLPMGRAAIARAIRRVRQGIIDTRDAPMSGRLNSQLNGLAAALLPAELGRQILAFANSHDEAPSLLLMPHGALERLPFEALPVGGPAGPLDESTVKATRRLGTDVSVAIVTKMRAAADMAPRVDLRKVRWTAVGAPDFQSLQGLDGAAKELSSLGRMNPRMSVLAGPRATRQALMQALGSGTPLHVSSHVVPVHRTAPGSDSPASGGAVPFGLAMSGDDVVTSDELAGTAPRLPLLVLAACASGDGDALDGGSVRGLAQVALDAGTRCTLLTQWPISDQSAYHASLTFHGALLAGSPPSEAARRARKLLRDTGRPMVEWSAYRLSGAW